MVSTSDRNFYNILLAIRSHGWARDVQKQFKKKLEKKFKVDEFKSLYTFYYSGLNVRSTDFNAKLPGDMNHFFRTFRMFSILQDFQILESLPVLKSPVSKLPEGPAAGAKP